MRVKKISAIARRVLTNARESNKIYTVVDRDAVATKIHILWGMVRFHTGSKVCEEQGGATAVLPTG
jgi:hypothetical protein